MLWMGFEDLGHCEKRSFAQSLPRATYDEEDDLRTLAAWPVRFTVTHYSMRSMLTKQRRGVGVEVP